MPKKRKKKKKKSRKNYYNLYIYEVYTAFHLKKKNMYTLIYEFQDLLVFVVVVGSNILFCPKIIIVYDSLVLIIVFLKYSLNTLLYEK
jgi:hypothetical protein